jgi:hypothetical protein
VATDLCISTALQSRLAPQWLACDEWGVAESEQRWAWIWCLPSASNCSDAAQLFSEENHEKIEQSGNAFCLHRCGFCGWRTVDRQLAQRQL